MKNRKQIWVDNGFDELFKKLYPDINSSRVRSLMLKKKLEEMLYGK